RVHQSTGEVAVADVKRGDQDLKLLDGLDGKGPESVGRSRRAEAPRPMDTSHVGVVGSIDLITVEPVRLSGERNPRIASQDPLGGQQRQCAEVPTHDWNIVGHSGADGLVRAGPAGVEPWIEGCSYD